MYQRDGINKGESNLLEWQYNTGGGFNDALFHAIATADGGNQSLIAKGFPQEVEAYKRFSGESGYFQNLVKKAGIV